MKIPEANTISEAPKQNNITIDFVLTVLKNDSKESESFKKILKKYFDECDANAEIESKLLKENGVRDSTVIARIRAYIKRINMQIELYKRDASEYNLDDLLDSLESELDSALQINCPEANEIEKIIDELGKHNG